MADVVVIGAGISGASSAYEPAKEGLDVLLVDRFGPAGMASGAPASASRPAADSSSATRKFEAMQAAAW